ncbi:MAG: PAS domain S-box protein [Desulfobacterales bacterium]|nr:PAS domain S-box protein [Desulfobacterales bacterium]
MNIFRKTVKSSTLSKKLLFYVVLCSSFFTILSTAFQLFLDYKSDVLNINKTMEFIEESYIEAITASVYEVDTSQVNLQLNGILKLPDIVYLEVKDSNSETTYRYSAGDPEAKRDFGKNFPLVHIRKTKEKEFVGYLKAYASYENIYKRLWERATVVIMTNGIKVFFVSVVLFVLFQSFVTKHLVRLSTYVQDMDLKTLDNPIELERGTLSYDEDELDSIVKSLNSMRLKMKMDISQRDLAEKELEKLKNYLTDILNSMPSVVIGIDNACVVTQWNHKAEEMTGFLSNEVIGKELQEIFPGIVSEEFLTKVTEGKPHKRFRTKRVEKENIFYEDISSYPLLSSKSVEGAVIRVDDVTEQVRMDAILVQNEKMMSVGGLAAGIAHEINTPLAIMMQSSQNILRRVSEDLPGNIEAAESCGISMDDIRCYMEKRNILRAAQDVRDYGEKAANIVSDILKFSQLSNETMEKVELTELLDQAIELASHDYNPTKSYDFKKIEIERVYESSVTASIIKIEIEQVILNILKNGAYAMGEKNGITPQFVIKCFKDNSFAVIEIEDNGTGINEDIANRIFEPFYTTKPVGVGTGLGLSVSYMIITKNHGGTLEVSSNQNGSKFTIKLPDNRI